MLVCRWPDVNAVVQNEFCSTIHLLSQYLLAQSHWWKHQMNVWNLLKVNYKDTLKMSLKLFWCPCCLPQTHFTSYSSVFSVSIVDFVWVVRATVPENNDIAFFAVCNIWFIVVRGELRTCDTSKMELSVKIVYNLKLLTILTTSSILRSIRGCWICLGL